MPRTVGFVSDYERPAIPVREYRDENGDVIDYGRRWRGESPPEDAYSRTSNLQRFALLHIVAESLIEWLGTTFDVVVDRDKAVANDLIRAPKDVVGAARVTPGDLSSSPLTIVLTSFPGVYVHAGALHDFQFPMCGCDACDDDPILLGEELEWTVRTVVSGGYEERFDPLSSGWVEHRLEEPGVGMRGGRQNVEDLAPDRIKAAHHTLPLSGHWAPWPSRP